MVENNNTAGVARLLPLPPATFHILMALAEEDRHGYAILQDVALRTARHGEARARHSLPLDPAHARAGPDRGAAGATRPRRGRRAPALLPDHRRWGPSVARAEAKRLAGAREAGARERLRHPDDLMRLYRALLRLYPASFRAEYGEETVRDLPAACADPPVSAAARSVGRGVRRRRAERAERPLRPPAAGPPLLDAHLPAQSGIRVHRRRRRGARHRRDDRRVLGRRPRALSSASLSRPRSAWFRSGRTSRTAAIRASSLARQLPRLEGVGPLLRVHGGLRPASHNLVGTGEPARVEGDVATAELLPMLGARALVGRVFRPEDDRPGAPGTLLLGEGLWRTRSAATADAVGRRCS